MRLCITGCAGFLGYWVASQCLDAGIEVDGVDDLSSTHDVLLKEWRLAQLVGRPGFRFSRFDVVDRPALERFAIEAGSAATDSGDGPFDAVVHLAAVSSVRGSIEDPASTYRTNVLGTLSVLEMCSRWHVGRFVLASSASVYGGSSLLGDAGTTDGHGAPRPSYETDATDGALSPYAASKAAAEGLCRLYHRMHGIDIAVLRYFTPYGPAGRPDMSVFRFIRQLTEGEPITVYGDGMQLRDYAYAADIARGTLAALGVEGYEVINLGSGAPVSINQILDRLQKHFGTPLRRIAMPPPGGDVEASWADITKARTLLGWSPSTPLDEGLRATIEWYRSHRDWLRKLPLDGECPTKPVAERGKGLHAG